MRKLIWRMEIFLVAAVFFWLGARSAGAGAPEWEQVTGDFLSAAEEVLDREKAELYLREKVPILLHELAEVKKYFPESGN